MNIFLGVDGGGSKTDFVLIDTQGQLLARHEEGSSYYPQIGLAALHALLTRGIASTLAQAGVAAEQVDYAFLGIPAYGEDSRLLAQLDALGAPSLREGRYRCDNDMVCGWAGALACNEGISVVAGTGSIAYGEYGGRKARAGGWGELFSDEGSAYWVAREGLNLFSRMSDGRAPHGPLRGILRSHFGLTHDLDLCAAVYGTGPDGEDATRRSNVADLARLVAVAAQGGDIQARAIFTRGAQNLAAIIAATRSHLQVPPETLLAVSYSGGMFHHDGLLLPALRQALAASGSAYELVTPLLPPGAGAALYASLCCGERLSSAALAHLQAHFAAGATHPSGTSRLS